MIKLHVVKETIPAIQSSNSLPFITNFNLFVNAKTLTDFSTYVFQGRNPILLLSIQSDVRLIEISQIQLIFSVRVRLIEVSAE